jgi:hypothetical protein
MTPSTGGAVAPLGGWPAGVCERGRRKAATHRGHPLAAFGEHSDAPANAMNGGRPTRPTLTQQRPTQQTAAVSQAGLCRYADPDRA